MLAVETLIIRTALYTCIQYKDCLHFLNKNDIN